MGSIEIVEYTKRDLRELLADDRFWVQPRLPITKRRVASHISNPRTDDNDTLLITARNQGQLVAYLGILPDLIMSDSLEPMKFGWLTAWWADKEGKSRTAATMVLLTAMRKYSNRVAASFPSRDAIRVYDATKQFQQCARFDLSYFVLALPRSFGVAGSFMGWVAGVKNSAISNRRKVGKRGLEIRTADSLDEGVAPFIDRWAATDPLRRDASCWSWILKFPWISASREDEAEQKRYAFSVFAKQFRQIPVLVMRRGAIIAFLVLTFRDGRLYLKYAYYDLNDVLDVAAALKVVIAEVNPWVFVSADPALNVALRKGFPFYLARRKKSAVVYSAKVLPSLVSSRPQFGVGDIIFT
jgi:hypothetical protein